MAPNESTTGYNELLEWIVKLERRIINLEQEIKPKRPHVTSPSPYDCGINPYKGRNFR